MDGSFKRLFSRPSPVVDFLPALHRPLSFLIRPFYQATKHAVRALSEGLRTEVKPYNIRTTIISPGAVATDLPHAITDPEVAESMQKFYDEFAIPADSFARAVVFAMRQPDDMDVNEILFRPIRQDISKSEAHSVPHTLPLQPGLVISVPFLTGRTEGIQNSGNTAWFDRYGHGP